MPSKAFTSAGTTLAVTATAPATYNAAGYAALTWVPIAELTDIGEFGQKYNLVTHNPISSRQTIKRKGSYNNGTLQLKMARAPSDAGQALLVAAANSDASYSYRVTLQDGTKLYFTAQAMGYATMVGSVDTITGASLDLEIDENIIEVPFV